MSDAIEVSIVIPCLNESETIKECVMEAFQAIHETGFPGEVIVADNGSTDNSVDIARKAGARIVQILSKGYGHALQGGILGCSRKICFDGRC